MDKKKKPAKQGGGGHSRHPVPKSGDGMPENVKLDKAKAMHDIKKIFTEVAAEYPEFLEETEAEEQPQMGDGNLLNQMNKQNSGKKKQGLELKGASYSGPVAQGSSQKSGPKNEVTTVKKGVSFAGVSTQPETRRQLKMTTVAQDEAKPRKPKLPPPPAGPPPKKLSGKITSILKPAKKEPNLVEIYSNKAEFKVSDPVPSEISPDTNATSHLPSSSASLLQSGLPSQIVKRTETEIVSEESPRPCSKTKRIPPMGEESRIALACDITLASTVDASEWPMNKNVPIGKPMFDPFQARVPSVPERIEHEDFASEFIKSFELSPESFDRPMRKESILFDYLPKKDTNASEDEEEDFDEIKPPPLDSFNSLKLVHKYPIWPHQVGLHKTLSHLPSLKSIILDDSEIKGLRDLGSYLPSLITLSVMRCQLKNLDGTFGLPNLQNLFAADNKITSPAMLSCLEHIRFVDLSGNPIESFQGFAFLRGCSNLKCLKLIDTKIARNSNFQIKMRGLIPSLRDLQPKTPADNDEAINEYESYVPMNYPEAGKWYEYKVKRDVGIPLTTESGPSDSGRDLASIQNIGKKKVTFKLNSTESDNETPGESREAMEPNEIDALHEELQWREEEKRLREVFIPARAEFKKRGLAGAVIPIGIDEMDAFLDELEVKNDFEGFPGHSESMAYISPLLSPLEESSETGSPTPLSSAPADTSDSATY